MDSCDRSKVLQPPLRQSNDQNRDRGMPDHPFGGAADQHIGDGAVAVGTHGLIVEVHHAPEEALSDGAQSLYPDQFDIMCRQVRSIYNDLKESNG